MIERRYGEIPTLETRYESNQSVDKEKRYAQIINELKGGKQLTAKQIAVILCNKGLIPTSERNYVSPRITELMQKGIVEQIGKQKCEYSNKMVAVFKLYLNDEIEIIEEEKKIPKKLPYYSIKKIQKAKNKDELQNERITLLERRVEDLHITMNDLLDYLKSKG